jgi:hypothetical protein
VALKDLARTLRGRAHVLVAAASSGPGRPRTDAPMSTRQLRRVLVEDGLQPCLTYVVRQQPDDVRHLVPLAGSALRWYVRSAYLPSSKLGAWLPALATLPGSERLLRRLLFPAVAVVARRGRVREVSPQQDRWYPR